MLYSTMYAAEGGTESTITASDIINQFNTVIETGQNVYIILAMIVAALLIILSIIAIRRRSVQYSKKQISAFKTNGKYIPGIFVELNESKEVLRYFLYGKKWKHRIIRRFNYIYDNVYGEILKKGVIEEDLRFHLSSFASIRDVVSTVDACLAYHDRFRNRKVKLKPEYAEAEVLFEILYNCYYETLEELQNKTKAAANNYLVLTGSAGNGKTNLLCSFSELAIKLGHAVVFLNSREIEGNIGTFILKCLNVHEYLIKHN